MIYKNLNRVISNGGSSSDGPFSFVSDVAAWPRQGRNGGIKDPLCGGATPPYKSGRIVSARNRFTKGMVQLFFLTKMKHPAEQSIASIATPIREAEPVCGGAASGINSTSTVWFAVTFSNV